MARGRRSNAKSNIVLLLLQMIRHPRTGALYPGVLAGPLLRWLGNEIRSGYCLYLRSEMPENGLSPLRGEETMYPTMMATLDV